MNRFIKGMGALVISAAILSSPISGVDGALTFSASAVDITSGTTCDGITYECVNGILSVTGYSGSEKDIVIPQKIEDIKVSGIATEAFKGSKLDSVNIQAELSILNESAFENSTVKQVILPNTIKKINRYAFKNCQNLTSINFPEGLIEIGGEAFINTQLGDIVFPESLQTISAYAFAGSYGNITSIKVTGATSIGRDAFQSAKLKSVDMGSQSTQISGSAFYLCSNLETVKLSSTNTFAGGGIGGVFGGCSSLKSIDLSSTSQTYIPESMFSGCTSLESVILPPNCYNIGSKAFYQCKSLENIVIPENCLAINDSAFREATYLIGIYIPQSTTSISSNAFDGCNYLKISTPANSYAVEYANTYGIPYAEITTHFTDDEQTVNGSISSDNVDKVIGNLPIISNDVIADFDSEAVGEMQQEDGEDPFTFVFKRFIAKYYPHQSMKEIIDDVYLKDGFLIDCDLVKGNKKVLFNTNEHDGSVSITIPFNLPKKYKDVGIFNVDDNGQKYEIQCKYNDENKTITFTTTHFSYFVVEPVFIDTYVGLKTNAGNNQATLTWNEVSGATGYAVYYSTDDSEYILASDTVNDTNYTITGLNSGQKYYFKIKANVAGAWSDFSETVDADIECLTINAHKLLLGDNIGVKFYMEFADEVLENSTATMVFNVNGNVTEVLVNTANQTPYGYEFDCSVAAAEMTDIIKGQLYVGGSPMGDEFSYSVNAYAEYILNNPDKYSKELPVVKALLNYGTQAQLFFNHNTDNLANSILEDNDKVVRPITTDEIKTSRCMVEDNDKGIDFLGQVIGLKNKVVAKYYFSGDITADMCTVNGKQITPEELCTDENGTYIAIFDISPDDYDKPFEIVVGNVTVSNASVFSYLYAALENQRTELYDIAYAMYAYNKVSEAYVG